MTEPNGGDGAIHAQCAQAGDRDDDAKALHVARIVVALQEKRRRRLRQSLFLDPAWDMLLDLFIARSENRSICTTSLCIAGRVPITTGYRYIKSMEEHGEVHRKPDRDDQRRVIIEISDGAYIAVRDHLLDLHAQLGKDGIAVGDRPRAP